MLLTLTLGVFIHKDLKELLDNFPQPGIGHIQGGDPVRYNNSQLRDKPTPFPDAIDEIVQHDFDYADGNVRATQTGELLRYAIFALTMVLVMI